MKKLLLIACLLLAGCCGQNGPEQKQTAVNARWSRNLPPGATEITELGNDWVTFRWNHKKYLFYLTGTHGGGRSAIVELREE
jgi:hypothetical protein